MANPVARGKLLDLGQMVLSGTLITSAGVLLAVNLAAAYDFVSWAKVRRWTRTVLAEGSCVAYDFASWAKARRWLLRIAAEIE